MFRLLSQRAFNGVKTMTHSMTVERGSLLVALAKVSVVGGFSTEPPARDCWSGCSFTESLTQVSHFRGFSTKHPARDCSSAGPLTKSLHRVSPFRDTECTNSEVGQSTKEVAGSLNNMTATLISLSSGIAASYIKEGHQWNFGTMEDLGEHYALRTVFYKFGIVRFLKTCGLFVDGHINLHMGWMIELTETAKFISIDDFMVCFHRLTHKEQSMFMDFMIEHRVFVFQTCPKTMLRQPITISRWYPPPEGWMKLNVDGSFSRDGKRAGLGGVFRLPNGEILKTFAWDLPAVYGPLGTELIAVYNGLMKAIELDINYIILESDCKDVVEILQNLRNFPEEYGAIVSIIFDLLKTFIEFSVDHVFREANRVADRLAYVAALGSGNKALKSEIEYLAKRDMTQTYFRIVQDPKLCSLTAS